MVLLTAHEVQGVRQQLDLPQALEQRDEVPLGVRWQVCPLILLVAEPLVLALRGEVRQALAQQLRHPLRLVLVQQA